VQLREKQKVRRIYGVLERQFRRFFSLAERQKGITGENLLVMLERRLDNVVYRMGYAPSRAAARQVVLHGHLTLDGKKVNIPSLLVKPGQVLAIAEGSKDVVIIKENLKAQEKRGFPSWVDINVEKGNGTFKALPGKDDIALPVKEQLIVELYSK